MATFKYRRRLILLNRAYIRATMLFLLYMLVELVTKCPTNALMSKLLLGWALQWLFYVLGRIFYVRER